MHDDVIFWVWFTLLLFFLGIAARVPAHVRRNRRDVVGVMVDVAPKYELVNAFHVGHPPAARMLKEQGYLPVILLVKNVVSGACHAARLPENRRPISHCIYRRVYDPEAFALEPYSTTFPYFSSDPTATVKKK